MRSSRVIDISITMRASIAPVWVTTGASDASQIEITEGLQEGDEVATTAVQENPYGMMY